MDCIFCKIINGEIPSETIYENEHVKVFLDIMPNNKGHSLVIPKRHSTNLTDIDEISLEEMFKAAKHIAPLIMKATGATAFNVGWNNFPDAGQVVMHSHIHIIPRHKEDGYKHWPHVKYADGEMKEFGDKIRKLLKD